MKRERVYKTRAKIHRPTRVEDPESVAPKREKQKVAKEIEDGMDDLLAEIDSVLEENAEEFVKSYVQKGGQ